ncbi:MAG: 3D domain-containing protein [Crocinitomicaceae bacterium]|nr:3D domain-containing protein [Crocinitomicaceae bacterium]
MKEYCLSFLLLIIFPLSSSAQLEEDSFNTSTIEDLDSLEHLTLWATEYYVHITQNEGEIPYLTVSGDTLGYFSDLCNFCTSCLEGTVFIESDSTDVVVLNYAARSEKALVNCRECAKFQKSKLNVESWGSVRWKVSSGFGEGVKNFKLVPFRTVAVDPKMIPYGTVLFIPAAVGVAIESPDGKTYLHDGYFFAGDTGGAIKGSHIDVFTGVDSSHPFSFVKSSANKTTDCYIVTDEKVTKFLRVMHQK